MKKLFIILTLVGFSAFAQDKGEVAKIGHIGVSKSLNKDLINNGFGVTIGMLYGLNDQLSIGAEGNGALSIFGKKAVSDDTNLSVMYGLRALGQYKLTKTTIAPFVALTSGFVKIGGLSNLVEESKPKPNFVIGPRAGLKLGNFKIFAEYSLIPKKFEVSATQKYDLSYFQIGFGI